MRRPFKPLQVLGIKDLRAHSVMNRPVAVGVAFSLALASIVMGATVIPLQSATAASTSLLTAADSRLVAKSVAASAFPGPSTRAVVAPASNEASLAQAAALSSNLGVPLVVAKTSSSSAEVIADVQARGASHVILIGAQYSYTTSFVSSLGSSLTIDSNIAVSSDFSRSSQIAALNNSTHLVVVKASNAEERRLGALYAVTNGFALAIMAGTESRSNLRNLISDYSAGTVTLIGEASSASQAFEPTELSAFSFVTTTDLIEAQLETVYKAVATGAIANNIVVAPSDQFASVVLAAALAHARSAVALSAGSASNIGASSSATRYLSRWAIETSQLTLVGISLTTGHLSTVAAPTTVARTAQPAWRFTGTTPATSTWNQTFTLLSGASRYAMFDIEGTQIGSATSSPMVVTGAPRAAVLVAFSSAGTEIGRLEFRANQYLGVADKESAIIGSTRDGTNHIRFVGTLKTPRLITRTQIDPFVEPPTRLTEVRAVTCITYFVDTGIDETKQYSYTIQTLSGASNRACDPSASLDPTSFQLLNTSSVDLPATVVPQASSAVDESRSPVSMAASPTLTDSLLLTAAGDSTARSDVMPMAAAGSEAAQSAPLNVAIRYQAFIQENVVPYPLYSGDVNYPIVLFGGDNRGPGYSYLGSRYQIDTNFFFDNSGLSPVVVATKQIGETKKYHCSQTACILAQTATQSTNSIRMVSSSIGGNRATARVVADSNNPIAPISAPINADITFKVILNAGASTITGTHDLMPTHEIFVGIIPGEYYPSYVSDFAFAGCLYGGPGCVAYLNTSL